MDLRATAYVFSEANCFEKVKNPCKLSGDAKCKSFNDVFTSCSGTNSATKAKTRDEKVSNKCSFGTDFDTNSTLFYYDSGKKVSKVSYLTDANTAKNDCKNYAGPWKANRF